MRGSTKNSVVTNKKSTEAILLSDCVADHVSFVLWSERRCTACSLYLSVPRVVRPCCETGPLVNS